MKVNFFGVLCKLKFFKERTGEPETPTFDASVELEFVFQKIFKKVRVQNMSSIQHKSCHVKGEKSIY